MTSSGCFYEEINEADVPLKLPNSLSSLRRTLSADLSPAHSNSASFMKRAQSSDHLDRVFAEAQDHRDQKEVDDHHLNIQEKKGAFDDIWSSILSTKNNESGPGSGFNPPYVHPFVRRSASSLSEKSLQVCTESLGSETGSDEFHPDPVEPELQVQVQVQVQVQDPSFVGKDNYNECESEANNNKKEYSYMRRAPPSPMPTEKSMVRSASFPPPLSSLSQSHHMRSHRRDGRLVVEAVSTPSTACLHAHRRDGHLLLTFSSDPGDGYNYHYNSHTDDDVADDDCYSVHQSPLQNRHFDDDVDDDDDDDEDVEEKVKELAIEFVMEKERASCKMIMTSKLIGSKKWEPRNFNATVINEVASKGAAAPPLLPPLDTSTTTALNAYEYCWRRNSTTAVVMKDENGNYNKWVLGRSGNKITAQSQTQAQSNLVMEEVVLGKEYENLIPFWRGCKAKEPRRSLLFLEPYCIIATS